MFTKFLRPLALALATMAAHPGLAMELVMVEQNGCHYCERWNDEVGPIYPKTPEGQFAPLRRIDLRAPVPEDLTLNGPAIFTPTFILVENGTEQARIEGYAGDELFWAMLAVTLRDHSDFGKTAPKPALKSGCETTDTQPEDTQ